MGVGKYQPLKATIVSYQNDIVVTLASAFETTYLQKGFFNFKIWLWVSIGGLVGGMLGAKFLKKVPKKWLKIGFGAVICITAVKMIL